jgi:hypothetical protein
MNTYQVGDNPRCTFVLRDAAGELADPTALRTWFISPAGTQTTYVYGTDSQLVRESQGIYYMHVSLTAPGRWYYGVFSTGTGQAASPDYEMIVARTRRTA